MPRVPPLFIAPTCFPLFSLSDELLFNAYFSLFISNIKTHFFTTQLTFILSQNGFEFLAHPLHFLPLLHLCHSCCLPPRRRRSGAFRRLLQLGIEHGRLFVLCFERQYNSQARGYLLLWIENCVEI